jgi:hypothetical protein
MTIESRLEATMRKQLVLYAVQREMFCQHCHGILDVDKAVLLDLQAREGRKTIRMSIICEPCWGKAKDRLTPVTVQAAGAHVCEVIFGRNGSMIKVEGDSAAVRHYEHHNQWKTATPYRSAANIEGEQLCLLD